MTFPIGTIAAYAVTQDTSNVGVIIMLSDGAKHGQAIGVTVISETAVKFTNPGGIYGQAHNFIYGYYYI